MAPAWSARQTYWLMNVSLASTTYAFDAPARIARRSIPSRIDPPPRSTVRVTTSAPYCSLSHATATTYRDRRNRRARPSSSGESLRWDRRRLRRRLERFEPCEPSFQGGLGGEQDDERV